MAVRRRPGSIAPLTRASYWARVDQDELVDGRLEWVFDHHGAKQETVVLGKCGYALAEFEWQGGERQTAVVGNDEQGRLLAVVDRSGTIVARWSLRGIRAADGSLQFDLSTPSCALSVLNLTLPDGTKPVVDHGIVTELAETKAGEKAWRIEFGGSERTTLKIAGVAANTATVSNVAVHEKATYRLSEHGVELTADFEMQQAGAEGRRMVLQIDRRLELAAVRLNGAPINAAPDSETPAEDAITRYLVELPQSTARVHAVLQVIATAPLAIEKVASLPLVRLNGARWEAGTTQVEIEPPCVLGELSTKDCRVMEPRLLRSAESEAGLGKKAIAGDDANQSTSEKRIENRDGLADRGGRSIEFQLFNDHPEIELSIRRRRQQIEVAQGTAVTLRAMRVRRLARRNLP